MSLLELCPVDGDHWERAVLQSERGLGNSTVLIFLILNHSRSSMLSVIILLDSPDISSLEQVFLNHDQFPRLC